MHEYAELGISSDHIIVRAVTGSSHAGMLEGDVVLLRDVVAAITRPQKAVVAFQCVT